MKGLSGMILGSKPEDDRKFMPKDDNENPVIANEAGQFISLSVIARFSQENRSNQFTRHCERSEAIQCMHVSLSGLLRRFAPRNDG